MRYYNKNVNNKLITKLIQKIIEGLESTLIDYSFLYNEKELKEILNCREKLQNDSSIENVSMIEEKLKPLIFRTWKYEAENGNNFIRWLKDGKYKKSMNIISCTFGDNYTFCDSSIGIKYDVTSDGFIAACEKDAATIKEDESKASIYTLTKLKDGRVVNSYNFATPIITPKQIFSYKDNEYLSKHNEIILDSQYIIPIEVICLDDIYKEEAKKLSEELGIPNSFKIK